MDSLIPLVGIAAFAGVGLAIYRLVAAERERKAERAREAGARGFRPVVPPDPAVVARIVALHRRPGRDSLEVRELYSRDAGGYALYLFDLADTSSESTDLVCDRAVAIVAPSLGLPRFSLVPQLQLDGRLARLTNWLIQRLPAAAGGERVEFPSPPAFQQRYTIRADDEPAVRRFFTAERLGRLAETRHWMIEGQGEMLTLNQLELGPARRREPGHLADRLRDAERVWAIFAPER
jgi:hypothetical protein